MGIDWSLREGYAWAEDKEHCEEYGRMLQVWCVCVCVCVRVCVCVDAVAEGEGGERLERQKTGQRRKKRMRDD